MFSLLSPQQYLSRAGEIERAEPQPLDPEHRGQLNTVKIATLLRLSIAQEKFACATPHIFKVAMTPSMA
jgi:hypothetical protein